MHVFVHISITVFPNLKNIVQCNVSLKNNIIMKLKPFSKYKNAKIDGFFMYQDFSISWLKFFARSFREEFWGFFSLLLRQFLMAYIDSCCN